MATRIQRFHSEVEKIVEAYSDLNSRRLAQLGVRLISCAAGHQPHVARVWVDRIFHSNGERALATNSFYLCPSDILEYKSFSAAAEKAITELIIHCCKVADVRSSL